MTRTLQAIILALSVIAGVPALAAEDVRVISFSVEHGWKPDADLETIARQIEGYGNVDLWGLSEVGKTGWAMRLTQAAGAGAQASFKPILGQTNDDRLLAIYDADQFELLGHWELDEIHGRLGGRAPLVLHLRVKTSNTEFLFMVNHLHRSANEKRRQQAEALNNWAQQQSLPIIAVGDYNIDWSIPPSRPHRDRGFDLMTKDDIFAWVRPDVLFKTQCSERYNSVLDFTFVAGAAKNWPREARILEPEDS